MSTNPRLKPFVITNGDIQFLIDQVNFRPLFGADGNIIIAWDGVGPVYDFYGHQYADQGSAAANLAKWGQSYQSVTDLAGVRDVSGFWNNLSPVYKHWGDTGQIFPRTVAADYLGYLTQNTAITPATRPTAADLLLAQPTSSSSQVVADGAHTVNTVPVSYPGGSYSYTYETWNRLITTEQKTTAFVDGHHVFVNLSQTDTTTTTQSDFMVRDSGGDHVAVPGTPSSPIVEHGQVQKSGGELDGLYHTFAHLTPTGNADADAAAQTAYALAHQSYAVSGAVGGAGDTTATDGTAINIQNVVDYTPRMISRTVTTAGVTYDTWANHQYLADGTTPNPDAAHHQTNEIYYHPTTGEAVLLDWGQLKTVADGGLGQIDTQARLDASAGQNDHFIGGLNPGVSPSNGFFVLFGQFFDHGLDFIDKNQLDASGHNVTIKIALAVDDPLYGMLGPDGQPVHEITINRASVQTVDAKGSEYVNNVSPFIDQSQTYGSDVQRTNLLREWVSTDNNATFHAGMELLDGHTLQTAWAKSDGTLTKQTLPTLNELRANIEVTGRDALTWEDISNLRNRDASGHVTAGTSGEALLLDMNPRFDYAHLMQAQGEHSTIGSDPLGVDLHGVNLEGKVTSAIAVLNNDLHSTYGPGVSLTLAVNGVLTLTGLTPQPLTGASALYPWVDFSNFSIMSAHPFASPADTISAVAHSAVSDILMASVGDHYIAGDGRTNENFGLTSIHHVFHEEHNYQVDNLIDSLHRWDIASGDTTHAKLHEFQIDTGHGMNAAGDYLNANGSIAWNDEKMFQGAKLIVEMEYQHAAVDQYARNVSPNIQEFTAYSPNTQPDVSLEYSQVAFRFGHSTLRETIDTIDPDHGITGKIMGYALHDAFLNPEKFGSAGPGAILLGMSHQQMNEVDEFVTPALNQGLLGQPLDLAAINIARGRDIGIPTLNDFREALGMLRYTSWNDFGQNMQHPDSLVNFIAAYAFDGDMDKAQAIIGLADGSITEGSAAAMGFTVSKAVAFLSGDEAVGGAGTLGFNQIDTWLGGLAEVHQPGGLLGETFDTVFVAQIEALMDGDRFYYLQRLFGQQFGEEVQNGQLKDIVERNTGLTHLNGNIFGYADQYVDLGATKEVVAPGAEAHTTMNEHKYGDLAAVAAGTMGIYSNGGVNNSNDGHIVTIGGVQYVQDTRLSADNPLSAEYDNGNSAYALNGYVNLDGTPNSGAESNEVIVGSKGNDLIYGQGGDDTVYGDDGNDIIYGGYGIDRLYGGAGSDIIRGGDNPDLIDGGSGDDFLYGESSGTDINGNDQVVGGSGNDYISGGVGIDKLSGGTGDDEIHGNQDTDPFTHGSDGNDAVYGESGTDVLYGDNGDDLVVGGSDTDLQFGGDGDDIVMPGDPAADATGGSDESLGGDGIDTNDKGFDLISFSDNTVRPGGVTFDLGQQVNPAAVTPTGPLVQSPAWQFDGIVGSGGDDTLTGAGTDAGGTGVDASLAGKNWLVGGSGNDTLKGLGGNDIIVGGSIKLDALIGKYMAVQYDANGKVILGSDGKPILTGSLATYDHNNGNDGLTEQAQLLDALYQGASHRVGYADELAITGPNAGLLGGAETSMFDKHFTEMLRSLQFKDMVLGDDATNAHKGVDTAIYTGNLQQYTLTALDATGNVVVSPHLNWSSVFAIKITDNRPDTAFVDANGNPLLDANGNPLANEGTDLLVGIDKVQFADQTIDPQAYFDIAPALDLDYVGTTSVLNVAADNFSGPPNNNAYARGTGWATNWVEKNDGGNASNSGQIQVVNNALRFGAGSTLGSGSDGNDGAEIVRTLNLSGKTSATISFNVTENNFGSTENVHVFFAADGTNFVDKGTFNNNTNNTYNSNPFSFTVNAPAVGFATNAAIKFVVTGVQPVNGFNAHTMTIDNINVTTPGPVVDGDPGNNYTTSYTEQLTPAAIASMPLITDPDDATIASAKAVLRDPVQGDILTTGSMPAGITATVSADGHTVMLVGAASHADYQTALAAITFSNPTNDNPTAADRHIDVTVNDGLKNSNVATTTVHFTPVNDPATLKNDTIVTNFGTSSFSVSDAAFLANDTDPDSALSISGVTGANGLAINSPSHSINGQSIAIQDSNPLGGSFRYYGSGIAQNDAPHQATVTLLNQSGGTNLTAGSADSILVGTDTVATFNGGTGKDYIITNGGSDTVNAGAGDDSIIYSVSTSGNNGSGSVTSGHDIIDGGTNTVASASNPSAGDRFVLNGTNGQETFRIFSNTDDWDNNSANGIQSSAAHAGITGLAAGTEIVITRNGTINNSGVLTGATVLAELKNIEEITVNTLDVTANDGNGALNGGATGGGFGADTVQVIGNFAATSLNYSTITVNDEQGGATVDIAGLTSDHRIVFNTDANGHVVGDVRPQDVVNTAGSASLPSSGQPGGDVTPPTDTSGGPGSDGDYQLDEADDEVDGASNSHHRSQGEEYPHHHHHHHTHGDRQGDTSNSNSHTSTPTPDTTSPTPAVDVAAAGIPIIGDDNGNVLLGTADAETILGNGGADQIFGNGGDDAIQAGDGNDYVDGGLGNDVVFGGAGDDDIFAGAGNDMVYGDAGNDRIFGGEGNDLLKGGAGNDNVFGGGGDDTFVAEANDGDDIYYGDDISGGTGHDTIDFGAITSSISVDLGTGVGGRGSVMSLLTGNDTLFNIENVITGSGNDVIRASNAINVMDGGAGNDIFRFGSAAAANGDTIIGFETGDKIDLSEIDANRGTDGDQAFTLVTSHTGAAQLIISHETRPDGEYTVVTGYSGTNADPAFHLNIAGNHNLTDADFTL